MNTLLKIFQREKNAPKGLMPFEWAVVGYLVLTLLFILFTYTKVVNPESMLWGRFRILATMAALWGVYRLFPCRALMMVRITVQMSLLAWWYPDTFELNRMLPNMDHLFAQWEQTLFGCQPALIWASNCSSVIVSELMHMGYAAYYPMIVVVMFAFFFRHNELLGRAAFVVTAAFFIYYLIFDFLPVAGPTYYYTAVGIDQIAHGCFPAIGDYFNTNQECLPTPGHSHGIFYQMVQDAKDVGERPTAAFPSSHVSISTICMLLLWRVHSRRLFWCLLPIYIFLCLATVYIQAHYVIDALAGFLTAIPLFFLLWTLGGLWELRRPTKANRKKL